MRSCADFTSVPVGAPEAPAVPAEPPAPEAPDTPEKPDVPEEPDGAGDEQASARIEVARTARRRRGWDVMLGQCSKVAPDLERKGRGRASLGSVVHYLRRLRRLVQPAVDARVSPRAPSVACSLRTKLVSYRASPHKGPESPARGCQRRDGLRRGVTHVQLGLEPLEPLIADVGLEVLALQNLQRVLDLLEEVAVDFVLVAKIIVAEKEASLDPRAAHAALGAVRKQQARRPFQVLALHQLQVLEDGPTAISENGLVHAAAARRVLCE